MSAYIVDDKIINGVLLAVIGDSSLRLNRREEFAGERFLEEEDPKVVYEIASRIGAKLLSMNYDAVNQRYRETHEVHQYSFKRSAMVHAKHVYSAIKELMYQCCEGNVPETNPLFEELRSLRAHVAVQIMDDIVSW